MPGLSLLVFGALIEGLAIATVILINGVIRFVTEPRTVRSMEALRELSSVNATVLRGGRPKESPAEQIVPGDVVTADVRRVEASKLLSGVKAGLARDARMDKMPEGSKVAFDSEVETTATCLEQGEDGQC